MFDKDRVREFIFQRRSIRKYTSQPINHDDIVLLLEAGMAAPSANNVQPWYFVVIDRRDTLDRMAEVHPYGKMLFEAPLAIAVVGDTRKSPRSWAQDCSAATQNILLAVAGLGLGGVWLGVHPRPERQEPLKALLDIPEEYMILSLLSIGHPDEHKPPRCQYDESKVKWNSWDSTRKSPSHEVSDHEK